MQRGDCIAKGRHRPENVLPLMVPSLLAAFLGGLLVLGGHAYFVLTGLLLIAAGALMVFKQTADTVDARPVRFGPAAAVGAGAGFISGFTGVGGGVFLAPLLITLGWATPKRAGAAFAAFYPLQLHPGAGRRPARGPELAPAPSSIPSPRSPEPSLARPSLGAGCRTWDAIPSLRLFYCSPESGCCSARAGTPSEPISLPRSAQRFTGARPGRCFRAASAESTSMAR